MGGLRDRERRQRGRAARRGRRHTCGRAASGTAAIEGKIAACRYAREHNVPYLGICLGMQIAVIEFARNVAGIKDADSSEFAPDANCVIDLMPDQHGNIPKGGTMRLGAYYLRYKGTARCFQTHTAKKKYASGTATAGNSTNEYRERLTDAGLLSAAHRRTAGWWRLWSWRITTFL